MKYFAVSAWKSVERIRKISIQNTKQVEFPKKDIFSFNSSIKSRLDAIDLKTTKKTETKNLRKNLNKSNSAKCESNKRKNLESTETQLIFAVKIIALICYSTLFADMWQLLINFLFVTSTRETSHDIETIASEITGSRLSIIVMTKKGTFSIVIL